MRWTLNTAALDVLFTNVATKCSGIKAPSPSPTQALSVRVRVICAGGTDGSRAPHAVIAANITTRPSVQPRARCVLIACAGSCSPPRTMRILFVGDVVGRQGRNPVAALVPKTRDARGTADATF